MIPACVHYHFGILAKPIAYFRHGLETKMDGIDERIADTFDSFIYGRIRRNNPLVPIFGSTGELR